MKINVRGQLFLAFFILVFLIVTISGLFLSDLLKDNMLEKEIVELNKQTAMAALFLKSSMKNTSIEKTDLLAGELAQTSEARVTIILNNGKVIGDSLLTVEEIKKVENHNDRHEISSALKNGHGISKRYSITIGCDMIYVAERFELNNIVGIVRISKSLAVVNKAITILYGLLVFAGIVGLILAAIMSAFSSHFFSQAMRKLVRFVKQAAEGQHQSIKDLEYGQLGGIASSVKKMALELENTVEELALEKNRFEAVLESMADAVIALSEDRKVVLINTSGLILFNIGEQPFGKTLLETTRAVALNQMLNNLNPGQNLISEFDIGLENKRRILARAVRKETKDYVIVLQDVTELRRLENIRRDFVSNVSHELRTPISIVKANTETLIDGAVSDPVACTRFLDSILNNANRLVYLITDLLDISCIEEGKYEMEITDVQVGISLHKAAASLETKAMEKSFSINVEPCGNLRATGDLRAIDQILINFVDNAVKYSETKGRVTLRAFEKDGHVIVEVEDNGLGIDPQHTGRLFERFYRVDKGRSRAMGGTGLGLAIAKHLATAMNGEVGMYPFVSAANDAKTGSVFWLKLPLA